VRAGDSSGALVAYQDAADEAERLGRPGSGSSGFEVRLVDRTQIDLLTRALAELGAADSDLRA
jgi:hypothetical protein